MGYITREDTEVCTPCLKAIVKMSKWDNYECVTDESGTVFIKGYEEKRIDAFDYVDTENGNILFQLIKLYKDIFNSHDGIFSYNQQLK